MADSVKVSHVATEIEGNMLVERLKTEGIPAFVQEVGQVRPKAYSGGFASPYGVDVYVAVENAERAKELLRSWNNVQAGETELGDEAENSKEIPPEVLEYLEEIKRDKQQSAASRALWSERTRMISRVVSMIIFVIFIIFFILTMTMR